MPKATLKTTVIEATMQGDQIVAKVVSKPPITAEFLGRPGGKGEPGQDAIILTPSDISSAVAALDGAIN